MSQAIGNFVLGFFGTIGAFLLASLFAFWFGYCVARGVKIAWKE